MLPQWESLMQANRNKTSRHPHMLLLKTHFSY